jgi:glycosyltransferase involved in cell wall biosynthesis
MTTPFALILPSSQNGVGGAPMRWRALRDALAPQGCTVIELSCDRSTTCGAVCETTGRRRTPIERIWHHNRLYCPKYADALLATLTASGATNVICSGLETHLYVSHFAATGAVRVIYDMHNVEHKLYRDIQNAAPADSIHARLFSDEHIDMVADAERSTIASAHEVWCCTPVDRHTVLSTFAGIDPQKVRIVPNSVPLPSQRPNLTTSRRHACFVGRFDHYPNIVAARTLTAEVAPLLSMADPPLPLLLAGANVLPELDIPIQANVAFVADPPDAAALMRDGILLVPLTLGGGSRLKVLEAFAAGAPVVSTAKGVEGLDVEPGLHYLPAETPEEFAATALELSRDQELSAAVAVAAWELAAERYSIEALAKRLVSTAVTNGTRA